MKVLIVGSGGREHAMAWKLVASPLIKQVIVAPGNGGVALDDRLHALSMTDPMALAQWALKENVDFTLVGPEAPLAAGIVDEFRRLGLKIFGPTQAAAQLESSKAFAKAFMQKHGIPTAAYQSFTDKEQALAYVKQQGAPIVIKADGLAAGKGVVVAMTLAQAQEALEQMFSIPSSRVVIEDFLEGEEASFIVMVDGNGHILPLASSQDHKRLLDQDKGPNTGGMGAYSPAPVVTPLIHEQVMKTIIEPTIKGMADEGIVFTGFLYAGLMISPQGEIKTLEFNCRMGDPETQPILMRMRSDWFPVLWAAVQGQLDQVTIEWDDRVALGVVLAAQGYPSDVQLNAPISNAFKGNDEVMIFHAGTKCTAPDQLSVSGGRVACVTALGKDIHQAHQKAYAHIHDLDFEGKQFRKDIGFRALSS